MADLFEEQTVPANEGHGHKTAINSAAFSTHAQQDSNQGGEDVSHEQMRTALEYAYRNVLQYGVRMPVLANKLQENIHNTQGLWFKRQMTPRDIIAHAIWFETRAVQQWNVDRLGGRAQSDASTNVPNEDKFFPIRWGAIQASIEVRKQRCVVALQVKAVEKVRLADQSSQGCSLKAVPQISRKKTVPGVASNSRPNAPRVAAKSANGARLPRSPASAAHKQDHDDDGASDVAHVLEFQGNEQSVRRNEEARKKATKKKAIDKSYACLLIAPPSNVPFPAAGTQANVTAVELLVFFPRYTRCIDVIERLVSNGGTHGIFEHIMLVHCNLDNQPGSLRNTILKMVQPRMRLGAGIAKWTVSSHVVPANHDEDNLSIAGLRNRRPSEGPFYTKGASQHDMDSSPIQFKDLANHVETFPSGLDALDLTRCVLHAMKNPEEKWSYPRDFEALVTYLGGPAAVLPGHLDKAAFNRYALPRQANNRRALIPKRTHEEYNEDEDEDEDGEEDDHPAKRTKGDDEETA